MYLVCSPSDFFSIFSRTCPEAVTFSCVLPTCFVCNVGCGVGTFFSVTELERSFLVRLMSSDLRFESLPVSFDSPDFWFAPSLLSRTESREFRESRFRLELPPFEEESLYDLGEFRLLGGPESD